MTSTIDTQTSASTLPAGHWLEDDDAWQTATSHPPVWTLGIVVALPEELTTLTERKLVQGECFALNDNIRIVYAGAGAVNAEHSTKFLISEGVNCLMSWGCAAALSADLKPGDLVMPKQVLSSSQALFNTDNLWLQNVLSLFASKLSISTGILVESSRVVSLSTDKQRIHRQTGAVALDMETAAVIKAAQEANLPCLVIRAIADPVAMDLPQAVVHALNAQGQIEIAKLLRFLLSHPWQIPGLIKLGLHFGSAQKTLKIIANQLNDIINFKYETN